MKTINIEKGQRLSHIASEIESNTIFFKILTGIGATYSELHAKRNSIIIEPNVPVIEGKKSKTVLGVKEGITVGGIRSYLKNDNNEFKKILTTPESFTKVMDAMRSLNIDVYNEYFLLFDECDRTAKDIDFREAIILPMDDFFKFKNKAFVSATAIEPSDPRFTKQNFTKCTIKPLYDFSQNIELIATNNPVSSLKAYLKKLKSKPDDHVFIFFNTVNGIASLIEQLQITDNFSIFCSEKSKKNFKINKSRVHEKLDVSKFSKINFLTSRFYSAVDIELQYQPHVIMITDLNSATHTMIDPNCDAIQIFGRFRNGIKSLAFIANHDKDISYKDEISAIEHLNAHEHVYSEIKKIRDISQNEICKSAFHDALKIIPYAQFINNKGEKNYFMYDNYLIKERLKSYYSSPENWKNAFNELSTKGYFNVTYSKEHYKLKSFYPNSIYLKTYREKVESTVKILIEIHEVEEDFSIRQKDMVYNELKRYDPEIIEAFEKLGADFLLNEVYQKSDILKANHYYEQTKAISNFAVLDELKVLFHVGTFYQQDELLNEFEKIVVKYNLPYKRSIKDFERFYKLSPRTSRNNIKGRFILEQLFN